MARLSNSGTRRSEFARGSRPPARAVDESGGGKRARKTLIYIAGAPRSASTLICRILGTIPGAIAVGEALRYAVRSVARKGLVECSCGVEVTDCRFWKSVLPGVGELGVAPDPTRIRWQLLLRLGLVPGSVMASKRSIVRNVVERIVETSGARIVVDSSKIPGIAYLAARDESLNVVCVHPVRHPAGVIDSWSKKKEGLEKKSPLRAALLWEGMNLGVECFRDFIPTRTVRYEAFVESPRSHIMEICRDLGVALPECFVSENEVRFREQHLLSGNPSRFQEGIVKIAPQNSDRQRLGALCRVITTPLLIRYGYLGGERG